MPPKGGAGRGRGGGRGGRPMPGAPAVKAPGAKDAPSSAATVEDEKREKALAAHAGKDVPRPLVSLLVPDQSWSIFSTRTKMNACVDSLKPNDVVDPQVRGMMMMMMMGWWLVMMIVE
jgi:hypothetical protein